MSLITKKERNKNNPIDFLHNLLKKMIETHNLSIINTINFLHFMKYINNSFEK
jgi:hypothetical protein